MRWHSTTVISAPNTSAGNTHWQHNLITPPITIQSTYSNEQAFSNMSCPRPAVLQQVKRHPDQNLKLRILFQNVPSIWFSVQNSLVPVMVSGTNCRKHCHNSQSPSQLTTASLILLLVRHEQLRSIFKPDVKESVCVKLRDARTLVIVVCGQSCY